MAQAQTVDLSRIIDAQKIGRFHITLVVIAFIVVMADGYDIGAAAFAAPALIREWHISPAALGGLFSAGLFAGLFGPPDPGLDRRSLRAPQRDHRRLALLRRVHLGFGPGAGSDDADRGCVSSPASASPACCRSRPRWSTNIAPRRLRATLFILMFSGVTFGGGVPGLVAEQLHGRPMAGRSCSGSAVWRRSSSRSSRCSSLPESIKFLSLKRERHAATGQADRAHAAGPQPRSEFQLHHRRRG